MTMGGRFSFRRVALLLRSDAECVCPALLKVTLGAGFFLFLYFLATYGYDGSGIISVTTDAAMRWKGSVSKDCLVLAMVFGPSFVYAGMARPDARLAFMMRPASAAEKFVGRLLLSTVGVSALVLLAVAVADLLHLGFSLAAGTSDGLRSVMASLARETAGSVSDIFRPAPHDWPAALAHGLNAVAGLLFSSRFICSARFCWHVAGLLWLRFRQWSAGPFSLRYAIVCPTPSASRPAISCVWR